MSARRRGRARGTSLPCCSACVGQRQPARWSRSPPRRGGPSVGARIPQATAIAEDPDSSWSPRPDPATQWRAGAGGPPRDQPVPPRCNAAPPRRRQERGCRQIAAWTLRRPWRSRRRRWPPGNVALPSGPAKQRAEFHPSCLYLRNDAAERSCSAAREARPLDCEVMRASSHAGARPDIRPGPRTSCPSCPNRD